MIKKLIIASLSDDLLKPQYKGSKNKLAGHCYVASEAYYYLMGGKKAGLKPMFIKHEGVSHWWLIQNNKIIDLTRTQFLEPVPYALGKGKDFLTKTPSKRAKILIERVKILWKRKI